VVQQDFRIYFENQNKRVYSGWDLNVDLHYDFKVIISKIHRCQIKYAQKFDIVILPIHHLVDTNKPRKKTKTSS